MMHFARRHRGGLPVNAEISITNLVDVAFVLLIIFMITAPILQGGIELQLPEADAQPLTNPDPVTVSIAKDGRVFVGRTAMESLQEMELVLTAFSADENKQVNVKADTGVPYGRVAEVLGVLMKLGFDNVGLPVEPIKR
ncbi:MAG: biopolymer transporter ExbD [Gemmatimonadetes bacterium]|nr:biopolymer transporter ExbD [Gemmatimonadota bacterium]